MGRKRVVGVVPKLGGRVNENVSEVGFAPTDGATSEKRPNDKAAHKHCCQQEEARGGERRKGNFRLAVARPTIERVHACRRDEGYWD